MLGYTRTIGTVCLTLLALSNIIRAAHARRKQQETHCINFMCNISKFLSTKLNFPLLLHFFFSKLNVFICHQRSSIISNFSIHFSTVYTCHFIFLPILSTHKVALLLFKCLSHFTSSSVLHCTFRFEF